MSTATRISNLVGTPAGNKTSARSLAGNVDSKVSELQKDIADDILKKTVKRDFDFFLRYFLSLCLNGKAKVTFEATQSEIEKLQHTRYTVANEDENNSARIPQEEGTATTVEKDLIEKRDDALQQHLDAVLKDVLKIANDSDMRQCLEAFANSLSLREDQRYAPWVRLCNTALRKLKPREHDFLREAATHDLRTCRSDPKSIPTTFDGTSSTFTRKPDFVLTSLKAAIHVHEDEQFEGKPNNNFIWSQVLSCEEMKAHKSGLSSEATTILRQKDYNFTVARGPTHDPGDALDMVKATAPEPIPDSSAKTGEKRSRVDDLKSEPSTKRTKGSTPVSSTTAKTARESTTNKQLSARAQLAQYAMDMLSYSTGVKHVINTLIVDEYLWVWYYDRQGNIQSNSISIIVDFPRVLVLLLVFQRFTIEDWGIIPCLNVQAEVHLGIKPAPTDRSAGLSGHSLRVLSTTLNTKPITEFQVALNSENFSQYVFNKPDIPLSETQPITIQHTKYLSYQPYCLSGRATSVLEGKCGGVTVACKIYNPEVQRAHEGNILKLVEEIATKYDKSMLDYLPELYFSGDIKGCTTLRVRSMLVVSAKGYRTTRVLILPQLERLTIQQGDSFVKCWLQTVTCHAFLWRHGVEHGDPSLSNAMYNPTKKCGVLMDFDLSIIQWLPRVPGTDRTGTVPFMALSLLRQEYWDGLIARHYHHELEAFVWIIPIVFHAYKKGGNRDTTVELIANWITSDFNECRKNKRDYLSEFTDRNYPIQEGFLNHEKTLHRLIRMLSKHNTAMRDLKDDKKFDSLPWTRDDDLLLSFTMWSSFITTLRVLKLPFVEPFIIKLESFNPTGKYDNKDLFLELKGVYNVILKSSVGAVAK